MTDQLISFETAKLAKEKGYYSAEEQEHMFVVGDTIPLNLVNHLRDEDSSEEGVLGYRIAEYVPGYYKPLIISRPTQSLLQKWLREVHHIHITPECRSNAGIYFAWIFEMHSNSIHAKSGKGATARRIGSYQSKLTYEEALEQGLIEALKLIK